MDEMIEKVKNGYTLNIYKDKLELSTAVFKFIQSHIIHTLKKKDRFKFCVSGGSTPKSVYQLLSKSNIKWDFVDRETTFAKLSNLVAISLLNQSSKIKFFRLGSLL